MNQNSAIVRACSPLWGDQARGKEQTVSASGAKRLAEQLRQGLTGG